MKDPFRGEMPMLQKKKILKPPYIVILVVVRACVRVCSLLRACATTISATTTTRRVGVRYCSVRACVWPRPCKVYLPLINVSRYIDEHILPMYSFFETLFSRSCDDDDGICSWISHVLACVSAHSSLFQCVGAIALVRRKVKKCERDIFVSLRLSHGSDYYVENAVNLFFFFPRLLFIHVLCLFISLSLSLPLSLPPSLPQLKITFAFIIPFSPSLSF